MSVAFRCGGCSKKYNVSEAMVGKRVKCSQCGSVLTVPPHAAGSSPAIDTPATHAPAPARMAPPPPPQPAAAVPVQADDWGDPLAGLPDWGDSPSEAAAAPPPPPPPPGSSAGKASKKGASKVAAEEPAPRPAKGKKDKARGDKFFDQLAPPVLSTQRPVKKAKNPLILIGGAVFVVALVAGGAILAFNGSGEKPPENAVAVSTASAKPGTPAKSEAQAVAKKAEVVEVPETPGATVNWTATGEATPTRFGIPNDTKMSLAIPFAAVADVFFPSAPSRFFAIASADTGVTEVWDLSEMRRTAVVRGTSKSSASPRVLHPQGNLLLTTEEGKTEPVVWSLTLTASNVRSRLPQIKHDALLDFGTNNLVAVSGREVQIWDIDTAKVSKTFSLKRDPLPGTVMLSPGRKYVTCIGADESSKLGGLMFEMYDLSSGESAAQYRLASSPEWTLTPIGLGFSPAGSELAMGFRAAPAGKSATKLRARVVGLAVPTGRVSFDHKITDPLPPPDPTKTAGRQLEWLADRTGWLLEQRWLVERESGKPVWEAKRPDDVARIFGLRVVDEKRAVVAWTKAAADAKAKPVSEIATIEIPEQREGLVLNLPAEKTEAESSDAGQAEALAAVATVGPRLTGGKKPKAGGKPVRGADRNKRGAEAAAVAGGADKAAATAPAAEEEEAPDPEAVDKIIRVIEELGGETEFDQNQPGRPIVRVELRLRMGVNNAVLANLRHLTELEKIDVSSNPVGDVGLEKIQKLKKLKSLNLNETDVTDKGLSYVASITSLEELRLQGVASISDRGMIEIGKLTNLKKLDISQTSISDAGILALKNLTSLQLLKHGGADVSQTGINELRKSVPDFETMEPN